VAWFKRDNALVFFGCYLRKDLVFRGLGLAEAPLVLLDLPNRPLLRSLSHVLAERALKRHICLSTCICLLKQGLRRALLDAEPDLVARRVGIITSVHASKDRPLAAIHALVLNGAPRSTATFHGLVVA